MAKRVHELNQGEQEEPTELDIEESTDETDIEANSVIDTEEEEYDKEPNSLKPVEGSENPEPRVEQRKN
ncbi:hypothetical protein PVK06_020496 [Gossypium arboreum]|uniref:Uncharacterized protein n=1 Tax=Gossypium arboreum TaxID=29729 RepID=A0ABR0PN14_GOSAR|nr:hypothetical protein PVK06_020496 [Gossypium arboreum]